MTADKKNTAEIVPIRLGKKTAQVSEKKWGKAVMKLGFTIIPSLLLRAQQRLGLNPTQLAILLQLADYWWDEERKPYPSKKALSDRLGLSPRTIQRYIAELEEAGLVRRIAVLKCWETRYAFEPDAFLSDLPSGRYDWADLGRLVRRDRLASPDEIIQSVQRSYAFLAELDPDEARLAADPYGRERRVYRRLIRGLSGEI